MDTLLSIADGGPDLSQHVGDLARAAHKHDGAEPLSEQTRLNLHVTDPELTHVVIVPKDDRDQVVGYAQIDRRGATPSCELVVSPAFRRNGIGTKLWRTAVRDATLPSRSGEPGTHSPLRVWAHGSLPAAAAFAGTLGLEVVRELHELARPLSATESANADDHDSDNDQVSEVMSVDEAIAAFAPTHSVQTFDPDRDEQPWLDLNSRAFASHPEQGRLTIDDLRAREREPWFDAAGFFVVREQSDTAGSGRALDDTAADKLVGAVWTKIEPATNGTAPESGEIYVVGVDPAAQGRGLGRSLTALALAYLRDEGLATATLWTDADNVAAMATYTSQGFAIVYTDIQYAAPATS